MTTEKQDQRKSAFPPPAGSRAFDCAAIEDNGCDTCVSYQMANQVLRNDVVRLVAENDRMRKRIAQLLEHRGHVAADVVMDKMAEEILTENTD